MNFLPKNEFEYHLSALATYYFAKAKKREDTRRMKRLEKQVEEEIGVKAVPYDKITSGTSVTYNNKSALSKAQNELLELEAEIKRYEEIIRFIDAKYKYEQSFNLLNEEDKKFLYSVFYKGLSVKETAEVLGMNERYVYRKIKRVISEMIGVEEDE